MLKKFLSVLLVGALLMTHCAALGEDHSSRRWPVADGTSINEGSFLYGDRQQEHWISYTPNENISPVVIYGDKLTDKGDFAAAAQQAGQRGWYTAAGINGDYYVMATNVPLGIIIDEGRLISSDGGHYAVGFNADGSAFISRPQLGTAMTLGGEKYRLGGINKTAETGDFYLFTDDFGPRTSVKGDTRNMILSCGESLSANCEVTFTVEEKTEVSGSVDIPEGKMVLTLTADSDSWRQYGYDSISVGDEFTLTISSEEQWDQCSCAMGMLYKLVTDGKVEEGLEKKDNTAAPRTAVGIREDGTVIFYTVDGRQAGYSKGLTLSQTAERLVDLGCVEAGTMDGGASTNLQAVLAGDEWLTGINRPSLGVEREVSCYLILAAKGEGSGEAAILSLRQDGAVMLCGAEMTLTAGAADETGRAADPGPLRWSADAGEIDGSGKYIAPPERAEATVTAESDTLTASARISVISTPDRIRILNEKTRREVGTLQLDCGGQADLTAQSEWRLRTVTAEDGEYSWEVQGNIGEIDSLGRFTASQNGGAGKISVSAGECTASIDVIVRSDIVKARDFEDEYEFTPVNARVSREGNMDRVKYGYGSLRADYSLDSGSAEIPVGLDWAWINRFASVWIYSDGSGNTVYTDSGTFVMQLDQRGWCRSVFPTDGGIGGFVIMGEGEGTVWFDQLLLTDSPIPDAEPPWLELKTEGDLISARAYDGNDGSPVKDDVSLKIDGESVEFDYDALTGELNARIEETERIHRISLEARDRSGNIHSVSVFFPGELPDAFGDISGHWAEEHIGYMYLRGVVNGYETAQGETLFYPDEPVTRAQMSVMLCRWLGIDTSAYADTEADFMDADAIPAWAADSVRAAYALSIIQGVGEDDGVYFRPDAVLTRAQAVTMLGRCLEAGTMSADLSFTDAGSVPAWAERYTAELIFRGVINGYEDETLRMGDDMTRAQVCKLLSALS